jgi:hypothetical protein
MNADQFPDWLKQQAETIVKNGRNVREEIAKLSSTAAAKLHQTKDGFVGLSRSVLDGAVSGAQQAIPGEGESVLREVVAGLADGLAISANAVRLTLEESRGRGAQFAREDLKKVAEDFRGRELQAIRPGCHEPGRRTDFPARPFPRRPRRAHVEQRAARD